LEFEQFYKDARITTSQAEAFILTFGGQYNISIMCTPEERPLMVVKLCSFYYCVGVCDMLF